MMLYNAQFVKPFSVNIKRKVITPNVGSKNTKWKCVQRKSSDYPRTGAEYMKYKRAKRKDVCKKQILQKCTTGYLRKT